MRELEQLPPGPQIAHNPIVFPLLAPVVVSPLVLELLRVVEELEDQFPKIVLLLHGLLVEVEQVRLVGGLVIREEIQNFI